MKNTTVSDSIVYVGVDDKTIDLFESQYVVPHGVSYNSYLILDEKVALMDTVDPRGTEEWLKNVETALAGRTPDYLIVQHMEPDHAGSIQALISRYPDMILVGNRKTFPMMDQFFDAGLPEERRLVAGEGDTLCLGVHTLQFFLAPMVHWPEVMVTYEQHEKILFSADGFGKFGALDTEEPWLDEARRYYLNIVGKYGAQVQTLLKKASGLDIQMICPLHGPVLKENLGFYIGKYLTWSSYTPEEEGVVIACASIHGHTALAARRMAEILQQKGAKNVRFYDLARDDMAEVIASAFRYDTLLLAAASYDGGVFPCMEDFLHHLKAKNFQKRTVGYLENGSWALCAGKTMKAIVSGLKDITEAEPMVSIKSSMKPENLTQMEALADALLARP